MIRLTDITATAHPDGNRIDLTWSRPDAETVSMVKVLRRTGTYPVTIDDDTGVMRAFDVVADGDGCFRFSDEGLAAEEIYYYTLCPFMEGETEGSGEYVVARHNRVSAMATGPYDFAGVMYDRLPAIYHRYDTRLPEPGSEGMCETDMQRGLLRRFMDLAGGQMDQLYSMARALPRLHRPDAADGRLLPLLAHWLGWATDHNLEYAKQRTDIVNAPFLFDRLGAIPGTEAMVKRVTGMDNRVKEYAHNVMGSNRPEKLNTWCCYRDESGVWYDGEEVFSLDSRYHGRASAATDEEGTLHLFYHSIGNDKWNIRCKTKAAEGEWTGSEALTTGPTVDTMPTAARVGNTLWLFWDSYRTETSTRQICFRTRTGGAWSDVQTFGTGAADDPQRKRPAAVVDGNGQLWLFWLEQETNGWLLKYGRTDGTGAPETVTPFPLHEEHDPRVGEDFSVTPFTANGQHRFLATWSRRTDGDVDPKRRYQVAVRQGMMGTGAESGLVTWQTVGTVDRDGDYDDREPTAVLDANDALHLCWTSTRGGAGSVLRFGTLSQALTDHTQAEVPVADMFSQSGPLPLLMDGKITIFYGSNRSIIYGRGVKDAYLSTDFRYSGNVTIDTTNQQRLAQRKTFDDILSYTCNTTEDTENTPFPYSIGTVDFFLKPDPNEPQETLQNQEMIQSLMARFLPILTRPIFTVEPN